MKRLLFECRCDTRLKSKGEGSTRLVYTRWREEHIVTLCSNQIQKNDLLTQLAEICNFIPFASRTHSTLPLTTIYSGRELCAK